MKIPIQLIFLLLFTIPLLGTNTIPITSVLIYTDRAQITRSAEININSGENKLVLEDLPPALDDESLRAAIQSNNIHIVSVNSYLVPVANFEDPEVRELNSKIRSAEKEKQFILLEQLRLKNKLSFLQKLQTSASKAVSENIFYITNEKEIPEWKNSFNEILNDAIITEKEQHSIQRKLTKLNSLLTRLNKKMTLLNSKLNRTKRVTEITLNNTDNTPVKSLVEINYIVHNTGWLPLYNISIKPGNQVEVSYLAEIRQETGEDWNNVNLSLSTAVPDMVQYRPAISSVTLQGMVAGKPQENIIAFQKNAEKEDIKTDTPQKETGVFLIQTGKKYSYASSKKTHSLTIDNFKESSIPYLKTIPKMGKRIFEISELQNPLKVPLLPGKANIFRNGGYIGRIDIHYISPGIRFHLPSGLNNDLLANYAVFREKEQSGILGNNVTIIKTEIMKLQNASKKDQSVVLETNMPVSDTDTVTIEIVKNETTPGFDEKYLPTGILHWKLTVPANGETKVMLKYKVTLPEPASNGI